MINKALKLVISLLLICITMFSVIIPVYAVKIGDVVNITGTKVVPRYMTLRQNGIYMLCS